MKLDLDSFNHEDYSTVFMILPGIDDVEQAVVGIVESSVPLFVDRRNESLLRELTEVLEEEIPVELFLKGDQIQGIRQPEKEMIEIIKIAKILPGHSLEESEWFDLNLDYQGNLERIKEKVGDLEQAKGQLTTPIPIAEANSLKDMIMQNACRPGSGCALTDPTCIPFESKRDGCFARAHWMVKLTEEQGFACRKIRTSGDLVSRSPSQCKGMGKPCFNWIFHIAVVYDIENEDGESVTRILDPSLSSDFLTKQAWENLQLDICRIRGGRPTRGVIFSSRFKPSTFYLTRDRLDPEYRKAKISMADFCRKCKW